MVTLRFDPLLRPEDNLAAFFAFVKDQDRELGELLESHLGHVGELSREQRQAIAREAITILRNRQGGAPGV